MKIFIVFGTRPEAIKLAPLIYKLREQFSVRVVSSGQHSELLQQVIDFFRIEPDYSFGCMTEKPDLEHLYECIHKKMRTAIDKEDPDLIIVQGDTFSAYSACFVGFLLKKPVFHLEAGLRTFKKFSPFPEEMLRLLISRISDLHFAPTEKSQGNLLNEGISKDRVFITGNTVVDALHLADKFLDENAVLEELSGQYDNIKNIINEKKLILVTSHRRENIGEPLKQICSALIQLAASYKDTIFLWPLHKNPAVREIVSVEMKDKPENIILTETLSYQTMIYLMKNSHIIMTDSGGIQEEAPTFSKPVMILREDTERQEVIDSGFGFLVGSDKNRIVEVFASLYNDAGIHETLSKIPNPFGDGLASERILQCLMRSDIKSFIETYNSLSYKIGNFKL